MSKFIELNPVILGVYKERVICDAELINVDTIISVGRGSRVRDTVVTLKQGILKRKILVKQSYDEIKCRLIERY